MPAETPPSFQFYPRDFVSSRAVASMTPEARGGYILLLCHAWLSPDPGVLPNDDEILAMLSQLGPRWPECRTMVRRAFAERVRNGESVLVQDRMVAERAAQRRRYERAAEGARVTNASKRTSHAQRSDSGTLSGRYGVAPASASAFASAVESTHTVQKTAAARAREGPADPDPGKAAAAAFGADALKGFEAEYPEHDVVAVAQRILASEKGPGRDPRKKLRSWLEQARRNGWDPKPAPAAAATNGGSGPHDGDLANSPAGPVVWWQGSWRSESEAADFGWKRT